MPTGIAWTDETWNPTTGCTRVNPDCDHCYAFTLHDSRYARNKTIAVEAVGVGPDAIHRARLAGIELPFAKQYDTPFSRVQLFPERLSRPLSWERPRRIFVDSMADLFHEDVPDGFIWRVYAVALLAPSHTFQILTKRPTRRHALLGDPERAREAIRAALAGFLSGGPSRMKMPRAAANLAVAYRDRFATIPWPLPNVWEGVSAGTSELWAEMVPPLLNTHATVRFVSCEPMRGPVDGVIHYGPDRYWDTLRGYTEEHVHEGTFVSNPTACVDWVICGGESGERFREMDLAWVERLAERCRLAGTAFFFKQVSGLRPGNHGPEAAWNVQEFPYAR